MAEVFGLDVIENILARLDVKDLIRYKSVCKFWQFLISTPFFVNLHLHHSSKNNNDNDVGSRRIRSLISLNPPQMPYYSKWQVVGSSNGLVCIAPLYLDNPPLTIFINNPCTREIREVLNAPILDEKIDFMRGVCLSFGYDSSTDDYKVVMGTMIDDSGTFIHVFSLKSNTWKFVELLANYEFINNKSGIILNGAIHWCAIDYTKKKRVILSFDLSLEKFKIIPQPDHDSRYVLDSFRTLGIVEDHLCISCNCDLWILKNYNVKRSWELLPKDWAIKYHVVHNLKMYVCCSPYMKRLSFYCDDKTCLSTSREHVGAHMFVKSLVSPYVNSERPSYAGSDKVAEQEWGNTHVFQLKMRRNVTEEHELLRGIKELYMWRGYKDE